jgi:uncharacterized protein (TIGR03067 family)
MNTRTTLTPAPQPAPDRLTRREFVAVGAGTAAMAALVERARAAPEQVSDKAAPAPDAVAKAQEACGLRELQGDWRQIQLEVNGQKHSAKDKGWLWKWRGPMLQRTGLGGKSLWCVAHTPAAGQLDLIFLEGDLSGDPKLQTVPCIFKVERGHLIVCLRHETRLHWGRPSGFTAEPDSWQIILTFERTKEPLSLKGAWEVTEMYVNGSRLDELATRLRGAVDRRVVFSDSTFAAESLADGKRIDMGYKIDPTKEPKQITLSGPGPKSLPGIYRVDFDTLWLCFDEQGKEAPKDFTSREGSRQSLWILKKAKSP